MKLIDIYNYLIELSNIYYKQERNLNTLKLIVDDLIYLFNIQLTVERSKYENIISDNLDNIYKLIFENNKSIKKINSIQKKSNIYFKTIENENLITDLKLVPCSKDIFSLWIYCFSILQVSGITNKHIFICNECGKVNTRITNRQRFCKSCGEKIDTSKIAHRISKLK